MATIFAESKEAMDEPIILPVRGRDGTTEQYIIMPMTGEDWVKLSAIDKAQRRARNNVPMAPGDQAELEKISEREYGNLVVGEDNFTRLLTSSAHPDLILAVVVTASTFHLRGETAAAEMWKTLAVDPTPEPVSVVPNRVAKRRTSSPRAPKVKSIPKQD